MKKPLRQTHQVPHVVNSRSYILRLWRVDEPPSADWHASLEEPATGERFGFSTLEELFVFLMELSERDSGMFSRRGTIPVDER